MAPQREHVSIQEAARRLGVSQETIRRRLRTKKLAGTRQRTAQGFVWLVEVDAAVESFSGESSTVVEGAATREVLRLEAHVADLRATVARLEGELDVRRREVSELHTLLGMAQRALPVPQVSDFGNVAPDQAPPTQPPTPEEPSPTQAPRRRSWWQRLFWIPAGA